MGVSPGVIKRRNVDVNIFNSLKKGDLTKNGSNVTQHLLEDTKYQSLDVLSDKEQEERSKRSTIENILAPIKKYKNSRDSQRSSEKMQSQFESSHYTISPFTRVPKQVGDRSSTTDVAST